MINFYKSDGTAYDSTLFSEDYTTPSSSKFIIGPTSDINKA